MQPNPDRGSLAEHTRYLTPGTCKSDYLRDAWRERSKTEFERDGQQQVGTGEAKEYALGKRPHVFGPDRGDSDGEHRALGGRDLGNLVLKGRTIRSLGLPNLTMAVLL